MTRAGVLKLGLGLLLAGGLGYWMFEALGLEGFSAGIAAEAGYPVSFMSFFSIGWPMMWIAMCVTVPYLCLMIQVGYV